MATIYGIVDKAGEIILATDGSGCYDTKTGNCYCAECFYYGDAVNCANAGLTVDDGLVPISWDKENQRFVVANE